MSRRPPRKRRGEPLSKYVIPEPAAASGIDGLAELRSALEREAQNAVELGGVPGPHMYIGPVEYGDEKNGRHILPDDPVRQRAQIAKIKRRDAEARRHEEVRVTNRNSALKRGDPEHVDPERTRANAKLLQRRNDVLAEHPRWGYRKVAAFILETWGVLKKTTDGERMLVTIPRVADGDQRHPEHQQLVEAVAQQIWHLTNPKPTK